MTILTGVFKQYIPKLPVPRKDGGTYDAAVLYYTVNGQVRTKNMALKHLEFNPHLVPILEKLQEGDVINIEEEDSKFKSVLNITKGEAPVGAPFSAGGAAGAKKATNDSGMAVGHAVNNAIALIVAGKAGKGLDDIVPVAGKILEAVHVLQTAHAAGKFAKVEKAAPAAKVKPPTPAAAVVAAEDDEEEIEF